MASEETTLQLLVASRKLMREVISADSCIVSTRIGLEVCKYFGVQARPVAVGVVAFNAPAWREYTAAMENGTQLRYDDPASHSLGTHSTDEDYETGEEGGRWRGHLIIETPEFLVDLSADQFDRPAKGIHTSAALYPRQETWERHRVGIYQQASDGTVVVYREEPHHSGYRGAPDWTWTRNRTTYRELTARIIKAIRTAITTLEGVS